jgi:hypothetical protein
MATECRVRKVGNATLDVTLRAPSEEHQHLSAYVAGDAPRNSCTYRRRRARAVIRRPLAPVALRLLPCLLVSVASTGDLMAHRGAQEHPGAPYRPRMGDGSPPIYAAARGSEPTNVYTAPGGVRVGISGAPVGTLRTVAARHAHFRPIFFRDSSTVNPMLTEDGFGYPTPEEGARGDIPAEACSVVWCERRDDRAVVLLQVGTTPPYFDLSRCECGAKRLAGDRERRRKRRRDSRAVRIWIAKGGLGP